MSIAPPGHPAPPPAPELPAGVSPGGLTGATWSAPVAVFGGLGLFIAAIFLAAVPQGIGVAFGDSMSDPGAATTFFSILVQDAGIIAGVWLVVRATGTAQIAPRLGLRSPRFWPAVGWLALTFVCYLVFAGVYSQLIDTPEQTILEDAGAKDSLIATIAICFCICVMAPLAEELLFRGFIFGGLRRWRGFWPAAIISGSLFGLAHVLGSPVETLPILAFFGFGLAFLYELTKSLYPSIYLHAINNSLAFSVGLELQWEWILVFAGSLTAISFVLMTTRRLAQ
ncbi:MAG TPA: type II CAAX endopeptidase family protein [Baekduia sp.]|nr:type II CAAX endopeptidase family protein [Baekduia sp.]